MKMALLGWALLEQDVTIIQYSDFINKQIGLELL
jgi:hypothetical protein